MKFNEQLARNALKRIEENPQEWNQKTWRCDTGMCFAGFVAMEAGAHWASSDIDHPEVRTPNGDVKEVEEFAGQQLGLYSEDDFSFVQTPMHDIFAIENEFDDIKRLIDELADASD